jgi:hypothetical protein
MGFRREIASAVLIGVLTQNRVSDAGVKIGVVYTCRTADRRYVAL